MKTIQAKLIVAALLTSLASIVSARTIEMNVNGLVCGFCAKGIEKTLKTFPATDGVLVDLEHHLVAVKVKDGADIDDARLRKAITDAGFSVVSIRRSETGLDALRKRAQSGE